MKTNEKKKQKLDAQIQQLENELRTSLHKKTSGPAISVAQYTSRIQKLKIELQSMR